MTRFVVSAYYVAYNAAADKTGRRRRLDNVARARQFYYTFLSRRRLPNGAHWLKRTIARGELPKETPVAPSGATSDFF